MASYQTLINYDRGLGDLDSFISRVLDLETASLEGVTAVPYDDGTVVRCDKDTRLFFYPSTPARIAVVELNPDGRVVRKLGQINAAGQGPGAHPEIARHLREFLAA